MFKKNAQIWVETVIYTLIGLAIIGLLLSIIKPAIEKKQDQILIDTSFEMMSNIQSTVDEVRYYGIGNTRNVDVKIKKGELEINPAEDSIKFLIESKYEYSQLDLIINKGRINILTKEKGKLYDVSLILNYSDILNLTWNDKENPYILRPAPAPYTLYATNIDNKRIDFS